LVAVCSSGKLIFHIFGALAEFERNLIRERTMAGLAAARARGRMGGRPKLPETDRKIQMARQLHGDQKNSIAAIEKTTDLYWYTGDDPINETDPSGLIGVPTCGLHPGDKCHIKGGGYGNDFNPTCLLCTGMVGKIVSLGAPKGCVAACIGLAETAEGAVGCFFFCMLVVAPLVEFGAGYSACWLLHLC
jgi:hypothetical protein